MPFFEAAGVLGGIVGAYDPRHLQYARSVVSSTSSDTQADDFGVVTKATRTIRSLLLEYAAPPVIDYWSLDTEGSELAILQSFPFEEYAVRVLTVEHNFTSAREEIRRFMEPHGYLRACALGIDDAYVMSPSVHGRAWQSRAWPRART